MRHLLSLVLALVLTPVIWVTSAYGIHRIGLASIQSGSTFDSDRLIGIALLLAAGAALGVLLGFRFSPIGPALSGLFFLLLSGLFLPNDPPLQSLYDNSVGRILIIPPVSGLFWMLGLALLVPLLSRSRWQAAVATTPVAVPPVPDRRGGGGPYGGPAPYGAGAAPGSPVDATANATPVSSQPANQPAWSANQPPNQVGWSATPGPGGPTAYDPADSPASGGPSPTDRTRPFPGISTDEPPPAPASWDNSPQQPYQGGGYQLEPRQPEPYPPDSRRSDEPYPGATPYRPEQQAPSTYSGSTYSSSTYQSGSQSAGPSYESGPSYPPADDPAPFQARAHPTTYSAPGYAEPQGGGYADQQGGYADQQGPGRYDALRDARYGEASAGQPPSPPSYSPTVYGSRPTSRDGEDDDPESTRRV